MADIKQAAKWMQEGKRVVGGNTMWPLCVCDEDIYFLPQMGEAYPYKMDVNDLLAEDWEVAE